MNEKTSFTIEEDLLEALGSIQPGEKSPLSLLYGTGRQITGDMIARVRAAGITDASGKIKKEYQHAVGTLAQTRSFARIKFSAGEKILEFIVYFPTDASGPVSLLHNGNKLVVEDPPGIDQASTLVDLHIGHSILSSTTFNGEFTRVEVLALFALMDLERSTLLHGLADNSDPQNAAFDLLAIMDRVKNPKKNFQSFEFVIQSRIILEGTPAPGQIENGLASLAAKGMVLRQGALYSLSDALYTIASRFLIIDSFVVGETGKLDQTNTMWGGTFLSLQAGVNDVLYLEGHDQEVIVRCITAAELLDLMRKILSDPEIITIPVQPPQVSSPQKSTATDSDKKFCPQCGTQVSGGKKFCNNCGAKIT
jgi:hypothetical protein